MSAVLQIVRTRCLLLVAAYAVSTVLPAVHHLFADEEVCETGADVGPALAVDCDGPCGDSTHHHHPAHDDHRCPVCQSAATLQWHLAAAMGTLPGTGPAKTRPRVARFAPVVADLRTLSARAPPPFPST